jgi:hypothetical protein
MNTLIEYNISSDLQPLDYVPSREENLAAEKAEDKINSGGQITKDFVQKLEYHVDKYPNFPRLKNLLSVCYDIMGDKENSMRILAITMEKHPDYFFGKSMIAQNYIKDNEPKKAAEVMGGFTTLKSMYPDRDVFSPFEIKTYHGLAVEYHSYMRNEEQAIFHLQILKASGIPDNFIHAIADSSERYSLLGSLAKFTEDNEKYNRVQTYFRFEDEQTEEAPVFNHPIIEELYQNDLTIGIGLLEQILTLDRPTLIEDLEKVAKDALYRFDYHCNKGAGDLHDYFVIHAIQLLAELRSYDSLQVVLELLRQNRDFEDTWFGDMIGSFFLRPLHLLGKERLNELEAYLKESKIDWMGKCCVLEALRDIAIINPECKQEIAQIFKRLFDFYWENKDNKDIIDGSVVPRLAGISADLQLHDLLPKIKPFYDSDLADVMIAGGWKDLEGDFADPSTFETLPIFTLEEQYQNWNNHQWIYHFTKEIYSERMKTQMNIDPEKMFLSLYEKAFGKQTGFSVASTMPLVSTKINRNDKVTVKYTDGKIINDVKYKKVEADVLARKCEIV